MAADVLLSLVGIGLVTCRSSARFPKHALTNDMLHCSNKTAACH